MKHDHEKNTEHAGNAIPSEATPDEIKRDFLKRFGGYAATAPAALFLLMSPRTSKAINSDGAP